MVIGDRVCDRVGVFEGVFSVVAEMSLPPCSQVRASGTPPSPVSLNRQAQGILFSVFFLSPLCPGVPAEPG